MLWVIIRIVDIFFVVVITVDISISLAYFWFIVLNLSFSLLVDYVVLAVYSVVDAFGTWAIIVVSLGHAGDKGVSYIGRMWLRIVFLHLSSSYWWFTDQICRRFSLNWLSFRPLSFWIHARGLQRIIPLIIFSWIILITLVFLTVHCGSKMLQ